MGFLKRGRLKLKCLQNHKVNSSSRKKGPISRKKIPSRFQQQQPHIQDFDEISNNEDQKDGFEDVCYGQETFSPIKVHHSDSAAKQEDDLQNVEDSLASFPSIPLQALKGCFDVVEDDENTNSLDGDYANRLDSAQSNEQHSSPRHEEVETKKNHGDLGSSSSLPKFVVAGQNKKYSSGSLIPETFLSSSINVNGIGDRDAPPKYQAEKNYSGPLHPQKREDNNFTPEDSSEGTVVQLKGRFKVEDSSEGTVVQLKGRFKVTSADRSPKAIETSALWWHLMNENKRLQAQLRDATEAVQAIGVRLKEAEEASSIALKRALEAEQEAEKAYRQVEILKKNQVLPESRPPKEEDQQQQKSRQPFKLGSSLKTLTNLGLSEEKKRLMEYSVFSRFLKVTNARESSANLIVELCKSYDVENQKFVFNNETTFSFCTEEVAHVLGIDDRGTDYITPRRQNIPQFVFDLKKELYLGDDNTLSSRDLKDILKKMLIDTPHRELWFKKLMSYFVVEQLLLCSSNPKNPRSRFWELVNDLQVFEKTNWAKAVYAHLLESLKDLKVKMENESEQRQFKGFAPVLEAILFKRIKTLRPQDLGHQFPDPPIQRYSSKRAGVSERLHLLTPDQIGACKHCGSGTALEDGSGLRDLALEDGSCSEAPTVAEVAPVKSGAAPKEASPKHGKESKKADAKLRRSARLRGEQCEGTHLVSPVQREKTRPRRR